MADTDHEQSRPRLDADWLLAAMVSAADTVGEGPSVTIAVRGMLVSGVIVSASEYYRNLTGGNEKVMALFQQAEPRRAADDAPAEYVCIRDEGEMHALAAKIEQRREHDDDLPRYVHLKMARFFLSGADAPPLPTNDPPDSTTYFRARLSSVDGFIAGRLGVVPVPPR